MKVVYTIIGALLVLFVIDFSLKNTQTIHLPYLGFLDVTLPAYMLIFLCFLAGVLFTGFMGIVERFRLNRTINQLQRTVRELKRELRSNDAPKVLEDETTSLATDTREPGKTA
jgi:uncharacterized integral membrane protein